MCFYPICFIGYHVSLILFIGLFEFVSFLFLFLFLCLHHSCMFSSGGLSPALAGFSVRAACVVGKAVVTVSHCSPAHRLLIITV